MQNYWKAHLQEKQIALMKASEASSKWKKLHP